VLKLLLLLLFLLPASADAAQCQGSDGEWYPYSHPMCSGGSDNVTVQQLPISSLPTDSYRGGDSQTATFGQWMTSRPGYLGDPEAWSRAIESGRQIKVVFDKTAGKFDDRIYTGNYQTDPMGTLQGGETYIVQYANGHFDCTGYNQGTGNLGTWSYPDAPAKPADNRMSLWGRVYTFDDLGNVYDEEYGLVGCMAVVSNPDQWNSEDKEFQGPGNCGDDLVNSSDYE
jgi:hypothetical protein